MYAKKSAKYMFCFIKASIHKNIQIITFELLTQGRMKAKARESARSEQFRRIFTTGIVVVVPCLFLLTNLNRIKAFFLHSSSSLSLLLLLLLPLLSSWGFYLIFFSVPQQEGLGFKPKERRRFLERCWFRAFDFDLNGS